MVLPETAPMLVLTQNRCDKKADKFRSVIKGVKNICS